MLKTLCLGAFLGAAIMLDAGALVAQSSTTRGFHLGVQLQGATLNVEGGRRDQGGGAGLKVGYGFNRTVTAFLEIDGAAIDVESSETLTGDWAMAHVDLGARFHFANALRRWVPYLEAAVGSRVVGVGSGTLDGDQVENLRFSGPAFTLGGGLNIYLKRTFAIDLGLKLTNGEFTEVGNDVITIQSPVDIDANSSRVGLGFVWWP